jgi:hypothetical protein
MKTRTISFRCPDDLLEEMEILCRYNRIDRSGFIVQALQGMLSGLARQGVVEPQPELPPSPLKNEEK